MEMSLLLSMAGFALAMSISPGPVNLVALGSGARYGFLASLRHVVGATLGFIMLLLLMGLGLGAALSQWPVAADALRWGGVIFLGWMAWQLVADKGELEEGGGAPPAFWYGALMQWLNPKAWLAASMGMGAYGAVGGSGQMMLFTGIYLVICLCSIACWAYAGSYLQGVLLSPVRLRWFNRAMALLLLLSTAYLVHSP
ncbi:LysE family translocator [Aeromonas enteropelogenes]|uniref:LysE family translocator n=1 Tax=Aeromonas enteropelogenes TaxID=29489 RepID=UPI002285B850|nr:LysE family translocator [Aeromonas enteropelogenes]MCZ0753434.1 LysE family translocator [Aeromonas enteropelogenes]